MKIFVARKNQHLGQFPPEDVSEGLRSGRFLPTDLAWREGMPNWVPLSQFEGLPQAPEPPSAPPPITSSPTDASPACPSSSPPSSSLAWERRSETGLLRAAALTIKQVLFDPKTAFSSLSPQGGIWAALAYGIITGWFALVVSMLYQAVLIAINPAFAGLEDQQLNASPKVIFAAILVAALIFGPILVILGHVLNALFTHFFLWCFGAARKSLGTTFRVICYAQGTTSLWSCAPLLGGLLAFGWYFYSTCQGLAAAHQTSLWRVILAMLTPLILVSLFMAMVLLFAVAAAAGAAAGS